MAGSDHPDIEPHPIGLRVRAKTRRGLGAANRADRAVGPVQGLGIQAYSNLAEGGLKADHAQLDLVHGPILPAPASSSFGHATRTQPRNPGSEPASDSPAKAQICSGFGQARAGSHGARLRVAWEASLAPEFRELVGREGIEPSTIRLKVECSTAELPARSRRAPERRRKAARNIVGLPGRGKGWKTFRSQLVRSGLGRPWPHAMVVACSRSRDPGRARWGWSEGFRRRPAARHGSPRQAR